MEEKMKSKDKSISVLLAIFLSFFSWIYTFEKDKIKFWVALGLNVLFWWCIIVPIGVWIWSILDVCLDNKKLDYRWE